MADWGSPAWRREMEQDALARVIAKQKAEENKFASGDYTVDPSKYSGDHAASNLSAALTRAQWNDWESRFAPLGEQIAQDIRSGARMDQALSGVSKSVSQAFDSSQASNRRELGRYGVQLAGQRKRASDTGFGIRKAATEAAAKNWTRDAVTQGNRELLMGGV